MSTSGSPDWASFYCSDEVVRSYSRGHVLQPPEQAILAQLGDAVLARSRVLDLGVGGGRTTPALASRCAGYVGADFAEPMVEACRQRFADLMQRGDVSFEVADARALPFAQASFDLVLFSFNGLDLVGGGEQRRQSLRECRRVLRAGGRFIFSSHNLNWLDSRRHVRWEGWRDYLETQLFWSRMRWLNRRRWPMRLQEVELVDPYGGGLTTYLRPAEMLRQCRAAGWSKVRAHGIDGRVIPPGAELDATGDPWIYFLCEE
ncbi:MAG: class I SAM-dependent methyltransferase [Sphaerotilus natans subsp. sulfidivorans]|uniref:class I SAM-dependent methyltransferase n=1 Tax=Sphaerotilus sulfidivorans TaxID=639200 RepID=UPI002354CA69|nr:class I SAM-dependent methyltransferase [Sphaerotilus sulfidivorans]MCK6400770.1 class I SAM-dependent methyltransferase [Sphaerotilus sulfidivorans]